MLQLLWSNLNPIGDIRGSRGKWWLLTLTLKAFANSSPGFALKPWVKSAHLFRRNSEGVATGVANRRTATQPFQGCVFKNTRMRFSQGCQSKLWARISERFQRYVLKT